MRYFLKKIKAYKYQIIQGEFSMDIKSLKSGSDFRGTAIEANGESINFSADVVKRIANAFALWLSKKISKQSLSIAVGHDSRLTGVEFKDAIIEELKTCGCTIFDCSLASTPSMYAMIKNSDTNCDGSIMITASHHPFHKNGLKFFVKGGGLTGYDLDEIIAITETDEKLVGNKTIVNRKDYVGVYAKQLVDFVRQKTGKETPLDGLKIVVDAGNGAGGFYAEKVLIPLGADTSGSQFLEPDGNFPNHVPNPEDSSAMSSIANCVRTHNADLGIIFDTDVDRAAVVGADGNEINRNKLIALISAILLQEQPNCYIVTDSVTSSGLKKFIQENGGTHLRYKRGYNNVISQAKKMLAEGKNAQLAIETSGHAALKENDYLDDGAYLVTRILIKLASLHAEGKKLSSLIETLEEPKSRYETRLKFIDKKDFKSYGDTIINKMTEFARNTLELESSTFEGVRANFNVAQGWFLLRQSVHDPILVLNIESQMSEGAKMIAKIVYSYLSKFENIDCQTLKAFAEN